MSTQTIRGNGFTITVIVPDPTPFETTKRSENITEDFFGDTANELRRVLKIKAGHAKIERVLSRKSSRRYGRSHRNEKPHKISRRKFFRHSPLSPILDRYYWIDRVMESFMP